MTTLTKNEAEMTLMKQELEEIEKDNFLTMEERVKVQKMIKIIVFAEEETKKIKARNEGHRIEQKQKMEKQAIDFVQSEFEKSLGVKMETKEIMKKLEAFSNKSPQETLYMKDLKGNALEVKMKEKKDAKKKMLEEVESLYEYFNQQIDEELGLSKTKEKKEKNITLQNIKQAVSKDNQVNIKYVEKDEEYFRTSEFESSYKIGVDEESEEENKLTSLHPTQEEIQKSIEEVEHFNSGKIHYDKNGNEIIVKEKTNEPKEKMLFYQPIIDEVKKECQKVKIAREKARDMQLPIVIKPYNFIIKGEVGLGKTELSREIHNQINSGNKIKYTTSAEMMSKYVGQSAEAVRKIVGEIAEVKGTLVVYSFESWLNHKSDTGTDHGLEPMKELVHLAKTKNFTLIFEGTEAEIESLFSRMPEMKDLFYKTIELASYKSEHLLELTTFKLKQNGFEIEEKALEGIERYYKENKAKNGHFISKTVQQLVVDVLMNDREFIIKEEDVQKLAKLNIEPEQSDTKRSYQEAMEELSSLTGQAVVKEKIKNILNLAVVQRKRKDSGKKEIKTTRHMVFSGSPGTGKTTIARIVGKLYATAGIISKGHFVEATIDQLTNAPNVTENMNRLVDKAMGGVLFIDEAYILLKTMKGREALDALIPLLENRREEFVCILAGYKQDMDDLKKANIGLSSRTKEIEFNDYSSQELQQILENIILGNEYILEDEAKEELSKFIQENKFEGNGRAMRNLFDTIIETQANRLMQEECEEEDAYEKITVKDIQKLKI